MEKYAMLFFKEPKIVSILAAFQKCKSPEQAQGFAQSAPFSSNSESRVRCVEGGQVTPDQTACWGTQPGLKEPELTPTLNCPEP